jgi:hypothetical protein
VLSDLRDVDRMVEGISAQNSYSYLPIPMKLFPYSFKWCQNKCDAFTAVLWSFSCYSMVLIYQNFAYVRSMEYENQPRHGSGG